MSNQSQEITLPTCEGAYAKVTYNAEAHLEELYVPLKDRGNRYGTALVEAVCEAASAKGCKKLYAHPSAMELLKGKLVPLREYIKITTGSAPQPSEIQEAEDSLRTRYARWKFRKLSASETEDLLEDKKISATWVRGL